MIYIRTPPPNNNNNNNNDNNDNNNNNNAASIRTNRAAYLPVHVHKVLHALGHDGGSRGI